MLHLLKNIKSLYNISLIKQQGLPAEAVADDVPAITSPALVGGEALLCNPSSVYQ